MVRAIGIVALLACLTIAEAFNNKIFLIRHGEKPADGGQGLDAEGEERAQCLTGVFGPSSTFNIGFIMAETPQSDGDRTRPLMTVTPLAEELGLTVDISCDRDDPDCVADAVAKFAATSTKNILICWEHSEINNIEESLGVNNAVKYPDDAFNLIFEVQNEQFISQTSENCPGLDD
ncbi:putative phosphoglycerate mutase family protein [Hysterangium stoloniferum]|nr:putative phosphoglycerate mutase family protein [Hysterangium stoloniferum]